MKTYIIDLDGTMYSGSTNIDGAREFIDYLHSKNLTTPSSLPFWFNWNIYIKWFWTSHDWHPTSARVAGFLGSSCFC